MPSEDMVDDPAAAPVPRFLTEMGQNCGVLATRILKCVGQNRDQREVAGGIHGVGEGQHSRSPYRGVERQPAKLERPEDATDSIRLEPGVRMRVAFLRLDRATAASSVRPATSRATSTGSLFQGVGHSVSSQSPLTGSIETDIVTRVTRNVPDRFCPLWVHARWKVNLL